MIQYGTPILHVFCSSYSNWSYELKPKLARLEEYHHPDSCYILRYRFAFYIMPIFGMQRVIEDDDACGVEWQGSSPWQMNDDDAYRRIDISWIQTHRVYFCLTATI